MVHYATGNRIAPYMSDSAQFHHSSNIGKQDPLGTGSNQENLKRKDPKEHGGMFLVILQDEAYVAGTGRK